MTCIYRGCDADADLICRPHQLALQLIGLGCGSSGCPTGTAATPSSSKG